MEGTDRVFERLVRDHQHRIYALGLALTGNRHDAEDVAQDTFVRAYRALATYPPERIRELKQKAWLHRIAVNVVRNRVRGVRPRGGRAAPCTGAVVRGDGGRARAAGGDGQGERPSRTEIAQRR